MSSQVQVASTSSLSRGLGTGEEIIEETQKDSEGRIHSRKYIKGRLLGKGGFAKVFLGTSLPNKTQYAFKIVQKSSLVKDRARRKVGTYLITYLSTYLSIYLSIYQTLCCIPKQSFIGLDSYTHYYSSYSLLHYC